MSEERAHAGFRGIFIALCAPLMLCVACMLASTPAAFADEPVTDPSQTAAMDMQAREVTTLKAQEADGDKLKAAKSESYATLTIIASTKNAESGEFDKDGATILSNADYAFSDGAVVLDLLNKAKENGNIGDIIGTQGAYGYTLNAIVDKEGTTIGDPNSFSLADPNGGDGWLYWTVFDNGGYASSGIGNLAVKANGKYQLVWCVAAYSASTGANTYETGAPTTPVAWNEWYAANPPKKAQGQVDPDVPAPPKTEPAKSDVDVQSMRDIMMSIADSYKGTSDAWQAMDLAALGMGSDVDKAALLSLALKDVKAGANPVKYVIALTALGYDCTALPDGDGTYDMINKDLKKFANSGSDVFTLINSLWALSSGDYDFGYTWAGNDTPGVYVNDLIDRLIAAQLGNGAFNKADDADATAMAVNALAPYAAMSADRQAALNKALTALKGMQLENGGWKDSYGNPNASSTAFAIIAMVAAGIDPATEWVSASGISPLNALLAYAVKTDDGYAFKWLSDDDEPSSFSTEQAFRAFVAYQGFAAHDNEPYDIYVDAKYGIADFPEIKSPAQDVVKTVAAKSDMPPKTGETDGLLALMMLVFAAAGAVAMRGTRRTIER